MSDYKNNKDPYRELASIIENTMNTVSSAVGFAARDLSGAWNGRRQEYFQNLHLKTDADGQKTPFAQEQGRATKPRRRRKLQIKRRGLSAGATIAISGGLLLAGCAMLEGVFSEPALFDIVLTAALGIGSVVVFIAGMLSNRLYKTACRYGRVIGNLPEYSVSGLANVLHISEKEVRRDLERLIEKNYLGKRAFLDYAGDRVIIDLEDASTVAAEQKPAQEPASEAEPSDEYDVWLRKIKEANQKIDNSAVNFCANRIHLYTEKIFEFIRQHPEDVSQIRTFMNYYLPMTLKLLQSYDMIEEAGIAGENMRSTKQSIEETLETLAGAYRQQLDNLYSAQAMDISADIDVLEQMLRRDGLNTQEDFSSGAAVDREAKNE